MRTHHRLPLVMLASLFLFTACGGGDDEDPCLGLDVCAAVDQTRCDTDSIQRCSADLNGCLIWQADSSCGENQYCEAGDGEAACVCEATCEIQGDVRCAGHFLQTCSADDDGCLVWSDTVDCSETEQACVGGVCVPAESCEEGLSLCVDNRVLSCVANTWSVTRDCTASFQHCETTDGVAACEGCGEGRLQCNADDTAIQTCVDDAWQDTTFCSAFQICDDSGEEPLCVCIDGCETEGATECYLNRVKTCTADELGCLNWVEVTCGPYQDCDDSSGTAVCVCDNDCDSEGFTQCQGNKVIICTADELGCLGWEDLVLCTDTDQTCVDGSCVD